VSTDITLVEQTGVDGKHAIEGHREILIVFREFLKLHPEAKKFELELDPAPWNKLYARPFIHVKDEEVSALLLRWGQQLEYLKNKKDNPTA